MICISTYPTLSDLNMQYEHCAREAGHGGLHRNEERTQHWSYSDQCNCFARNGLEVCELPINHAGVHLSEGGRCWLKPSDTPIPFKIAFSKPDDFHQLIIDVTSKLGPFLVEKNKAYGDAARKSCEIMKIYFPDGIPVDMIDDAYYMMQVLNKLARIAENNDPFGEDPWLDGAGYSALAHVRRIMEKKK